MQHFWNSLQKSFESLARICPTEKNHKSESSAYKWRHKESTDNTGSTWIWPAALNDNNAFWKCFSDISAWRYHKPQMNPLERHTLTQNTLKVIRENHYQSITEETILLSRTHTDEITVLYLRRTNWWRRLRAAGVDSPRLCSQSCLLWSPVWLSSSVTASPSSPRHPARSLSTAQKSGDKTKET